MMKLSGRLTGRYQRVRLVGVNWQLRLRIDDIFTQTIASFHQSIQVVARGVHFHPSRMILWSRRFGEAYCFQSTLLVNLLVAPYPICPHICTVEVGFRGIKDHAMDRRLVAILEVLNILLDVARGIDREDIPVAGIIVEGVAVHIIRRLLAGKEKYGARLRVCIVRFGYETCQW
mgnify:CR=1 FL=1